MITTVSKTFKAIRLLREFHKKWKYRNLAISSQNEKIKEEQINGRYNDQIIQTTKEMKEPELWPCIDLCMVTFNSSKWLPAFFKSLENQKYPLKYINLYFTDNSSTDDTVNIIENYIRKNGGEYSSIGIFTSPNLGFGAGTDHSISNGNSEFCLITNVDLEFLPDSITNAVKYALSDKEGIVASWELRQIPFEHPKRYDPVTLETAWSSHACILIRRSAYKKVGGYDRNLFMYSEDVELSYRFRSFGYHLKYIPKAKIIHHTYEYAGQIKPLQLIGSISGNFYLRLRYGNFHDKVKGILLIWNYLRNPILTNTRRKIILKVLSYSIKSFNAPVIGKNKTYYPFVGFDYLGQRFGHAYKVIDDSYFDKPLVTVIIRTYKGRDFLLKQSVQSVLNQTYPNIELIVTEDGGDTARTLINKIRKNNRNIYIRYLANEKIGRSEVANRAMKLAQGQYIVFLDDDDLFYSDHIEVLVNEILSHKDAVAAYSVGESVYTSIDYSRNIYKEFTYTVSNTLKQEWDYPTLYNHNFMIISVLFSKELFLQRGGFDSELEYLEDWNLWLRYGYKNTFIYVPKVTSLYRLPNDLTIAEKRSKKMANYERYALLKAWDYIKNI